MHSILKKPVKIDHYETTGIFEAIGLNHCRDYDDPVIS